MDRLITDSESRVKLILITGNIGAGKSSLIEKLKDPEIQGELCSERRKWVFIQEDYKKNKALLNLYTNINEGKEVTEMLAFQCQLSFLISFYEEFREKFKDYLRKSHKKYIVVLDRSDLDVIEVFGHMMRTSKTLSEQSYSELVRVREVLKSYVEMIIKRSLSPDMIVMLDGDASVLRSRISKRAAENKESIRLQEVKAVNEEYLVNLSSRYQEISDTYSRKTTVVSVDTSRYGSTTELYNALRKRIQEKIV